MSYRLGSRRARPQFSPLPFRVPRGALHHVSARACSPGKSALKDITLSKR